MVLQMGSNVVVCARIDNTDYEDIHFEEGSAIRGVGVIVLGTKHMFRGHRMHLAVGSPLSILCLCYRVLIICNGTVLGTFSTICAATTVSL